MKGWTRGTGRIRIANTHDDAIDFETVTAYRNESIPGLMISGAAKGPLCLRWGLTHEGSGMEIGPRFPTIEAAAVAVDGYFKQIDWTRPGADYENDTALNEQGREANRRYCFAQREAERAKERPKRIEVIREELGKIDWWETHFKEKRQSLNSELAALMAEEERAKEVAI